MKRPRLHKLVYMAHPYGGKAENLAAAKRWYRWILFHFANVAVVADWIITCEVFNDSVPEDRTLGMRANVVALGRCDELWLVGGIISSGMSCEINEALIREIPVFTLLHHGPEPPAALAEPEPWTP